MADQSAVDAFIGGIQAWRKFRDSNPTLPIDLRDARLQHPVRVRATRRRESRPGRPGSIFEQFERLDMDAADLSHCDMSGASITDVNLNGAVLQNVNLRRADLRGVHLRSASLVDVDLRGCALSACDLEGATLQRVYFGATYLGLSRLSVAGWTDVSYSSLCQLDAPTLKYSRGMCQLWSQLISPLDPALLGFARRLEAGSAHGGPTVFLSHSSKEDALAKEIRDGLLQRDIAAWLAHVDMRQAFLPNQDEEREAWKWELRLQLNRFADGADRLVVLLSGNCVNSPWVLHEVDRSSGQAQRRGTGHRSVVVLIDPPLPPDAPAWAIKAAREARVDGRGSRSPHSALLERIIKVL